MLVLGAFSASISVHAMTDLLFEIAAKSHFRVFSYGDKHVVRREPHVNVCPGERENHDYLTKTGKNRIFNILR